MGLTLTPTITVGNNAGSILATPQLTQRPLCARFFGEYRCAGRACSGSAVMPKKLTITAGDQFGKLTVIAEAERHAQPSGRSIRHFACRCDCGSETVVAINHLCSGHTKSCGCHHRQQATLASTTHGMQSTPTYSTWCAIKARCNNPKNTRYHRYGGRGIRMCQRWSESFEAFLEDMGEKPSSRHSIDRYPNNDGHYEPGNARWATNTEQARNRRGNRLLTIDGTTMCVSEWAEQVGLTYHRVRDRLNAGWSNHDAVFVPKGGKRTE